MVLSSSVGSEAQTSFNSKSGLNGGGGGGGRAYSKKDMEEALDALREKRLSLTRYSVSKIFEPSPWYYVLDSPEFDNFRRDTLRTPSIFKPFLTRSAHLLRSDST